MPAFTLYTARGSTSGDRVRLTLAEATLANYQTVNVDLSKGEQKTLSHLHPWGKVPAVVFDDGFVLYESRAICKYLASRYSIPLLPDPSDYTATAYFDQAQSVESFYFAEHAVKISFEKFAKPFFLKLPTNEAVVADATKALQSFFDIANGILARQEYMAGNSFTLVDIYYIPTIQRLFACGCGELVTSRPQVNSWWERCTSRPAVAKFLADERQGASAVPK